MSTQFTFMTGHVIAAVGSEQIRSFGFDDDVDGGKLFLDDFQVPSARFPHFDKVCHRQHLQINCFSVSPTFALAHKSSACRL